jgi:hypothetical protein
MAPGWRPAPTCRTVFAESQRLAGRCVGAPRVWHGGDPPRVACSSSDFRKSFDGQGSALVSCQLALIKRDSVAYEGRPDGCRRVGVMEGSILVGPMDMNGQRSDGQRPVFVDPSGRRQRWLRVVGAFGVLPAVGYVFLLLSTVLGGPTVQSPFLPLPLVRPPVAIGSPVRPPVAPPSAAVGSASSSPTSSPTQRSVVGVVLTVPTATSTSFPTASPALTSAPTPTAKAKGKPTSMPTPVNRPTKTAR